MVSLHEVEQHLRNVTDSPLAQHTTMPDARSPHNPLPATPPIEPKSESDDDAVSYNSTVSNHWENKRIDELIVDHQQAIVSRSHLMVTEPRGDDETRAFDGHADALSGQNGDVSASEMVLLAEADGSLCLV